MIFDPFMLWNYGSGLEKDSPRFTRKGDFFVFVAFVALIILVSDEL
jgi:Derlin-2/3